MHSWTVHGVDTVSRGLKIDNSPMDVVVDRAGTTIVAWSGPRPGDAPWTGRVRTVDDPPATGDPQDPTNGKRVGARLPEFSEQLGIDAADRQTLAYLTDATANDPFDRFSDLMVSDRRPSARWTTARALVKHRAITDVTLAVNASGAAVVTWSLDGEGGGERLVASYRRTRAGEWTPAERVPARGAFESQVGIDDAGRVLVVYDRMFDPRKGGVWAVRRTPNGSVGTPTPTQRTEHQDGRNRAQLWRRRD